MKACLIVVGAMLAVGNGCSHATQAPPASPPPAPPPSASAPAPGASMNMTPAAPVRPDVQFMRDMIEHHSQAIEIAALVPSRSTRENLKMLADRIGVAQGDEIKRMSVWLMAHGEAVPETHTHEHAGGHELPADMLTPHVHGDMPGMLTPEDFARLRAASGTEFDKLFLQLMIRHHEGALTMVERLFATPGGVQDADLFQLATNINADQRAEIARMNAILSNLQ
jgi:uncharacterized protein (DUF305 family)